MKFLIDTHFHHLNLTVRVSEERAYPDKNQGKGSDVASAHIFSMWKLAGLISYIIYGNHKIKHLRDGYVRKEEHLSARTFIYKKKVGVNEVRTHAI